MDKTSNLPVEVKNNLPIEQKRTNKRRIEGAKRVGKIMLNAGMAGAGLALMSTISGPVAATIGTGMWFIGGINAGQNILLKKQKDSMFATMRNIKGEIYLAQDSTNLRAFQKLKGLFPEEKAAVMGLELFVGLQNYQQQFKDTNKKAEPARESENNVYSQVFSTCTHGVNIKTMEALEKLGYLQIESKEPKRKSNLIFEKLGFKQYKEVKETLLAQMSFDKEKIKEHQKQVYEIKFKITDKPFDLDEIYKQYLEVKDTKGINPQRKPIRRIGILLDILKNRNIDIETDEVGRKRINSKAERPFSKRIQDELVNENNRKSFRESLQVEQTSIQQENEQQFETREQVNAYKEEQSQDDVER